MAASRGVGADHKDSPARGIASINSALESLLRLHASRRVVELQSELVHRKLSQPGLALLRRLTGGAISMGELARAAHMDSGAAARQVAVLEADGLVLRAPSTSDGRITVVSLTSDGEDVVRAVMALQQQHMHDALSDWSESEIDDFARALERFVTSLRRTDFGPTSPSSAAVPARL